MKAKTFFIFLVFLLAATSSRGQGSYFYINWDYNIPLSNTSWIEEHSGYGGKVGYRFILARRPLSVGVDFNWTTFYQYEPTQTIQHANGALTTDYYRFLYTYGVTASAQYYFPLRDKEVLFPYAGLGLGANYNDYTLYYNIYENSEANWGLLARPEAGVLLRFGERRSFGLMAAVHYDWSSNRSDRFKYNNFSMVGFQVGLMFMGR